MKDYAIQLVSQKENPDEKTNILREYLQHYILRIMQDTGVLSAYAFVGGTALRILYDLPRFSEDLDFSLVKAPKKDFAKTVIQIKKELELAGYQADASYKDQKTVQSAMIRFSGLLHEAGISRLKDQKLSVKIEIDTNPPAGAGHTIKIVNKYFPLSFLAHDLPSLLAGKTNALLSRKYTKGRDYYDIFWYLSRFKELTPNMTLLHNGLKQMGWNKEMPQEDSWRAILHNVVAEVDWDAVIRDVGRFLERADDVKVFTKENLLKLTGD